MKVTKNGHEFYLPPSAADGWWDAVSRGEWEPYTFDIFDKFMTPDTVCIDVGAWIGPTVLYASKLCKQVYALEPDPKAFKDLFFNVKHNSLTNVKMFNQALMNYDGIVTLANDGNLGDSGTSVNFTKNAFQVACQTLSTFVAEQKIDDVGFIKMDVEGGEEYILKDLEFFEKHKPVLYVSLHPFLFKNVPEAREVVRKVGRMYKNHYDHRLNKVDVERNCDIFVFTE